MPIVSGVSKGTGREWSSQEFVVEYNSNSPYPRLACFRIFGQDRIAEMNVREGELVRVSFDVESSEYNERWYTRLNAFRVLRIEQAAGQGMPYGQPYGPQQPMYGPQQPNYGPQQPNYGPQQPNYGPQQPQQQPVQPQQPAQPQAQPNTGNDAGQFGSDLPF